MNLLTTSKVAEKLSAKRDKVSYALHRMKMARFGKTVQTRVFDETAVALVENFLESSKFMDDISTERVSRLNRPD